MYSKSNICWSLGLIGLSLIGMAIFSKHSEYIIAVIWFSVFMIFGLWGLYKGIKGYLKNR